ncbi:hypothetical protein [Telmatospirillum sp. J64-1]|uniref:hypothetical protein n=1 Tax=Telmatospirillum sp. J64-1 TaxID=2502183 RepID=UPI00115D4798|nr:hypothetical protein [Telmatospirillum sp. J64-1]
MKIKVLSPFSFRPGLGAPVREFGRGVHILSVAEAAHPFIRACLADGLAEEVPGVAVQPEPPKDQQPKDQQEVQTEQQPEPEQTEQPVPEPAQKRTGRK